MYSTYFSFIKTMSRDTNYKIEQWLDLMLSHVDVIEHWLDLMLSHVDVIEHWLDLNFIIQDCLRRKRILFEVDQ